jgi:plasmid stabilization system protein ParE
MTRAVVFRPAARLELKSAVEWYEQRSPELGTRLARAVDRLVDRIVLNPKLFAVAYRGVRQARVRGFPFALYFQEMNDQLIVLTILHTSRDPRTWMNSVDDEIPDESQ